MSTWGKITKANLSSQSLMKKKAQICLIQLPYSLIYMNKEAG